jgi:hypothetical protein
VATLLVASMLTFGATMASANERMADEDEYEDAFSNPLRLAYYVAHPVGYALEWLVMRPFHYFISRPKTDKMFGYKPLDEEGTYSRMGDHM